MGINLEMQHKGNHTNQAAAQQSTISHLVLSTDNIW